MRFYKSCTLTTVLLGLQILSQHRATAEGQTCYKAPNSSQGVCVNIKRCSPYIAILQRYGTAAGQFLRSTLCYYQGNDPIVCCPSNGLEGKAVDEPEPGPTVPTVPKVQTIPSVPKEPANNAIPTPAPPPFANYTPTEYGPLYAPHCGSSNAQHSRVVGGAPADLGAWPWVTALGYKNKKTNMPKWLCGGSLISRRHVLTAAHCVYNRYDLYLARLGDHDLYDYNDGAHPIDVPIEAGILHPEYSAENYVNDIAILRLQRDVPFSAAIHPICLPIPPAVRNRDYVRNYPFIAGWGALYFHGPSSAVLQEVQLPVVSNEACKKAFAPFPKQVIDERVLCAGYTSGGKDACQGDSGGSLMFPMASSYYTIGIVSFGFRCAEVGFPGVYTRVTHFLDFIIANLN